MNKQGKSLLNPYTYLVILFLFIIMVTGIKFLGSELIDNENSALDNDSILYIGNLHGIDLTEFNVTREQIEDPIYVSNNESQGNPKDYALDFQFAKQEGLPIENDIKLIYSTPEVVLIDLLSLPKNNWKWLLDILNWFWRLTILASLILFARAIIVQK